MTTGYTHRCKHCDRRYTYYGSGGESAAPTNDADFCPSCKETILEALKAIPKAVKQFEVKASPEEESEILSWLRARQKNWEENGTALRIRQIKVPLFNLEDGYSINIEVVNLKSVEFYVYTRSDDGAPPEVFKQMERDLKTGAETPWYRCPLE